MQQVSKSVIDSLHEQALELSHKIKQHEVALIEILQTLDQNKGFILLGYRSLFEYVVEGLKISEARACNFITVARKAVEIPEIKAGLARGDYTTSKVRKIAPVLTEQNKELWLLKASQLSQKLLEKEVAKIAPQALQKETTHYVAEERLELRLFVSEKLLNQIKRASDLVSQNKSKSATLEDTLEELVSLYLEKKDPVRKAETRNKRPLRLMNESKLHVLRHINNEECLSRERTPLPAALQTAVMLRDRGECQFPLGHRGICGRTRWIHLHHIRPISRGGQNSLENLTTLCALHHRWEHKKQKLTG